ncbi:MAG: response regulator [bacterium]
METILPKLLVFEEDDTNLKILAFCFRNDFQVSTCTTEKEMNSKLKDNQHDLFLLNVSTKGDQNGFKLVKGLRQLPGYETTPIVIVTANVFKKDEKTALESGATKFFKKPIENKVLIGELKKCLPLT